MTQPVPLMNMLVQSYIKDLALVMSGNRAFASHLKTSFALQCAVELVLSSLAVAPWLW
jgi:hypothetical protein